MTNAVWHSIKSDRDQRQMVRAAITASPELEQEQKSDLLWLIKEIEKLADRRNDAIHSPYTFFIGPDGLIVMPSYLFDHPRANKLPKLELMEELKWYRKSAACLLGYAAGILDAMLDPTQTWPDRPQLQDHSRPHRRERKQPRRGVK